MKIAKLALVAAVALAVAGCSFARSTRSPIAFEPHSLRFTTMDLESYAEIHPQVTGVSEGAKVLGIGSSATVGAAILDALSKAPGSSVLLAPVVHEESINLILFSTRKVTVTGIPVEFKKGK